MISAWPPYNGGSNRARREPEVYSKASQGVFGPHRAHLIVGREFPTGRGGFRVGDSGTFFGRERHGWRFIRPGEPENNAGDVVLRGGRQATCCFKCVVEKFRHRSNIPRQGPKTNHARIVDHRSLPCPGFPACGFRQSGEKERKREKEKMIKREKWKARNSYIPCRPAGGVVEDFAGRPSPRDPQVRHGAERLVKGAARLARRHRRRAEPRAAQLLREHGEHAEEPPLEASEHRGTREAGPCPLGENSSFHENKNSNNTPFIKARNTISLKTRIIIIPLS
jgi:hypothetical protein